MPNPGDSLQENSVKSIFSKLRLRIAIAALTIFFATSSIMILFSSEILLSLFISVTLSVIFLSTYPVMKKRFLILQLKKMLGEFDYTDEFDLEEYTKSSIEEAIEKSRQRQRNSTNPDMLRNRPSDEKGMTSGVYTELDRTNPRIDAIENSADWDGLEDELTDGEKLVEAMNEIEAKNAQEAWERAEQRDSDNIEFGVKRLGDLVASGYFEKNSEDGAFSKLVNSDQED